MLPGVIWLLMVLLSWSMLRNRKRDLPYPALRPCLHVLLFAVQVYVPVVLPTSVVIPGEPGACSVIPLSSASLTLLVLLPLVLCLSLPPSCWAGVCPPQGDLGPRDGARHGTRDGW
jgi:hypothetical protein